MVFGVGCGLVARNSEIWTSTISGVICFRKQIGSAPLLDDGFIVPKFNIIFIFMNWFVDDFFIAIGTVFSIVKDNME